MQAGDDRRRLCHRGEPCERRKHVRREASGEEVRGIIKRDIEEAFAEDDRDREKLNGASGYKRLGMDMDRREWERVRKLWGSP